MHSSTILGLMWATALSGWHLQTDYLRIRASMDSLGKTFSALRAGILWYAPNIGYLKWACLCEGNKKNDYLLHLLLYCLWGKKVKNRYVRVWREHWYLWQMTVGRCVCSYTRGSRWSGDELWWRNILLYFVIWQAACHFFPFLLQFL